MSRASGQARPGAPPVRWHRHRSHGTHVRGLVPGAPLQAASRLRGSRVRFRGTAGHRPFGSCSWDDASGRFGLQSRRSWAAASGSRWAVTGVRNDRGARPQTVEGHDRRSCHPRPLTWRLSRVFPVLNTTQFHAGKARTDLARRKPGVQIPLTSTPQQPWSYQRSQGQEALISQAADRAPATQAERAA